MKPPLIQCVHPEDTALYRVEQAMFVALLHGIQPTCVHCGPEKWRALIVEIQAEPQFKPFFATHSQGSPQVKVNGVLVLPGNAPGIQVFGTTTTT